MSEREQGVLFARFLSVEANGTYKVDFPFAPEKSEVAFPAPSVRRAMVYNEKKREWLYVDPAQPMMSSGIGLRPNEWATVSTLEQLSSKATTYMKKLNRKHGAHGIDSDDEGAAAGEKKKKRMYTKRREGGPKRPRNAYILYMQDYRDSVRRENPGMQMKDVTKILSARWKEATPEIQQKYNEAMRKDRDRYQNENENWKPGPELKSLISDEDIKKDKNAPKMYRSPYAHFMMDFRAKEAASGTASNDREAFSAASKKIGEEWRSMSPSMKQLWVTKSEAEKKEYETKMSEYIKQKEQELRLEQTRLDPSHPIARQVRLPAPPPVSARPQQPADLVPTPSPENSPTPPTPPHPHPLDLTLDTIPSSEEMRTNITRVAREEAYIRVVDAQCEQSPYHESYQKAVNEYLVNRSHRDWKTFLVAVFGYDTMSTLLL